MSMFFRTGRRLSFLLLLVSGVTTAQTLEADLLRDLDLRFAPVEAVSERPGRLQLMRVDTLPDDRLQLRLPFRPNRLQRLVSDGSRVIAGTEIAQVSGPELGHWLLEASLIGERFDRARERYQRNQPLYEKQALSATIWQDIADRYHTLQLDMHHVEHVLEWLKPAEQGESSAMLVAPEDGLLLFLELPQAADGEIAVAELIHTQALRLSARLPEAQAGEVMALHSGDCQLPVASRETRVSGLSRRVWSEGLHGCLAARPGLPVDGYPLFRFAGFRVPRAAVIRHDGRTLLALKRGAELALQEVTVAGEDEQNFYLRAATLLAGEQVLVRSVSAVQGILLGLGSE